MNSARVRSFLASSAAKRDCGCEDDAAALVPAAARSGAACCCGYAGPGAIGYANWGTWPCEVDASWYEVDIVVPDGGDRGNGVGEEAQAHAESEMVGDRNFSIRALVFLVFSRRRVAVVVGFFVRPAPYEMSIMVSL